MSALPRRPIAYKAIALLAELTRRVFGFGAPGLPHGTLRQAKNFVFGAPKATAFEHLYTISYWFLENHNCASFRLPKITATDRAKQIREACYVY